MWIKNKNTGLIWEITNKSQIEKLMKDSDYVESRKEAAKTPKKES